MQNFRHAVIAAFLIVGGTMSLPATAQSTDGYAAIQVFPVVADTAVFVQSFYFHNNNAGAITLTPKYFPAYDVTASPTTVTPITCPQVTIPAFGTTTVDSLRTLCPELPAGSQFGFLSMTQDSPGFLTYAAFSRASNKQGAGFSVEGYPASTFTGARSVVNGIRRLAATEGSPAFQTNCFIGNINEEDNNSPSAAINYAVINSAGTVLGGGALNLLPGKMVRLLDVFAVAGVPAGNQDNVRFIVDETSPDEPGLISFCTVQDNTSYNADFRIAKQSISMLPGMPTVRGPQDIFAGRDLLLAEDVLGRPFTIPAGAFHNTHVFYLHQPDRGQCEIIDPNTNVVALPSYGLEIRAVVDGQTGAGGNNSVLLPDPAQGDALYFGDKIDGYQANMRVAVEVGSNGQNAAVARPYKLRCRTGSGSNLLDIIEYQVPGTTF
jgi:hypothetical protein